MDIGGEDDLPDVLEQHDGDQRTNLNISDVFDAISIADPSFGAEVVAVADAMLRPAGAAGAAGAGGGAASNGPYARIVEQPASKAIRFRYLCEGRSAGSIPGVNSTQDRKTYPAIEILNHTGRVIVVVSCVTCDEPYRPHPHNLVGRDRCSRGVCTVRTEVGPESAAVAFSNLGIQCVKRRDIAEALRTREELRVDPFRTGYGHRNQPQSIDLNAVRLCFQVFLPDETGRVRLTLPPLVSDVIYDKKANAELQILRISHPSGKAKGGDEVILLCEKVTREDIAVVLFEEGAQLWEESANIIIVHKQVAIAFTTPPYREPHTTDHVEVQIQLKRLSDNARSNSIPFTYYPDYQATAKRKKVSPSLALLHQIEQQRADWTVDQKIKSEPSEKGSPLHMTSPLRYAPLEQNPYPQWMPEMQTPGPSGNAYYNQDIAWQGPNYAQSLSPNLQVSNMPSNMPRSPMHVPQNMPVTSPNIHVLSPHMQVISPIMPATSPMHAMSPNMPVTSPNMHAMSPNMPAMSQNMQAMSPHMQAMSPNMQAMSPHHMQAVSPHMQAMSPVGQVMSPHNMGQAMDTEGQCGMGHVSPAMGHVSPNLVQQNMVQQQQHQQAMEASSNSIPSLSGLLMDRGDAPQFNSGDLSSLSAILGHYRSNELSDSLNRLSTSDLLNAD